MEKKDYLFVDNEKLTLKKAIANNKANSETISRNRGNNYFKKNYQYILNLGGSFEYWYKKKIEKKLKKILIKKYQIIETPPYEVHAIKFLEKNGNMYK